jgi:hypothetical protein
MIKSDPKVSPKADSVNTKKTAKPVVKTNSSAKVI